MEEMVRKAKLETIGERTRLLYVGITRARERLFMSGYRENPGRRNENLPSRYLLELRQYTEKKRRYLLEGVERQGGASNGEI